jgi:pyrroloquinoline-quinone synthase
MKHCNTPELQRAAVDALLQKCEILWAMLDAIDANCRTGGGLET